MKKKNENPLKQQLLNKIKNKTAILGVIGLGYVGLPLAVEKAKVGYKTIGFDIDEKKIKVLSSGNTYIKHIGENRVKEMIETGFFEPTSNFSRINEVDAISICVPTPLDAHRMPDLSYVIDSARMVSKNMKKGTLVILESTTYPGTTREVLLPILEDVDRKLDKDFFLVFSPEREDPGNKKYNTKIRYEGG